MEDLYKSLDNNQLYLLQAYNLLKENDLIIKLAQNLKDLTNSHLKDSELKEQIDEISKKINEECSRIINHAIASDIIQKEKITLPENRKPTRIFIEGVFDIIHSGHFNAIRQAKKLGDILVVGVNSDADVEKAKGPTLMNVKERGALIAACKWVDETVLDTPYTPTLQLLEDLKIDFVAHGDDPCFNENGEDVYAEMKKKGMFKVFKRTEGISTTEIIGRLLLLNKDNSRKNSLEKEGEVYTSTNLLRKSEEITKGPVVSSFLTTGWRLSEFCNNKVPKETDKVVYIDGAFDILHIGHVETLKKAKEMGDFLYVGVHDDGTINKHRGKNYPILNMQERVFNLLALKYVDDVVIGAPWAIKEDLIKSLRINIVVHGTQAKFDDSLLSEENDPHLVPKKLGIYQEIESIYDLSSEVLVKRLIKKRDNYIKKFQNKTKKEEQYYEEKEYIAEI